jgi:PhoPQ-activated pathogenicity-related protein
MTASPLDWYVGRADPSFGWRVVRQIEGPNHLAYVLELTSQTWLSAGEIDNPVWRHWLTVCVPENVSTETAFLYITGGARDDPPPSRVIGRFIKLAVMTGSVVAELQDVPNQPLTFAERQGQPLSEDALIAHCHLNFVRTRDPERLVRLPMVKSGSAAMTAIQEFLAGAAGGGIGVSRFVVSGGSKRGWTAWLVAAVDPRVAAVIPIVINVLGREEVIRHHWEAMGYFSPALQDYVDHGIIPGLIGDPGLAEAHRIEDPLGYADRPAMRMPKFVINAVGDEFFPPDVTRYGYHRLPDVKRLRMLPNSRHSTEGTDIFDSTIAFHHAVVTGAKLPAYGWELQDDGALVVTSDDEPVAVTLWRGTNPDARDFRVDVIGEAFEATPLERSPDGAWIARVGPPERGFTAWFVELTFASATRCPFKFTTEVIVTPDVLPYRWEDARPITAPA